MEDTLKKLNDLKACHAKYSFDDFKGMSLGDRKNVCMTETVQFVEAFSTLNTKDLIQERIKIKDERKAENAEAKRAFLDTQLR